MILKNQVIKLRKQISSWSKKNPSTNRKLVFSVLSGEKIYKKLRNTVKLGNMELFGCPKIVP